MEIFECTERADLLEEAVDFLWGQWGNPDNYAFYRDCITHSFDSRSVLLPQF
ncbi:hypothetical protein B4144_2251 [Bacillus atrophaeus]|nr:hypothetical protein B4144_2251 [Bacillus atrophaeus]